MPPHPPHPPHPPGPPRPHWERIDQLPDDELMHFAPPEIRRVYRKLQQIEARQDEILTLLRARGADAQGGGA